LWLGLFADITDIVWEVSKMNIMEKTNESIYKGDAINAEKYTRQQLANSTPWKDILKEAMLPALDRVGKEYFEGIAFLPELIATGMAMTASVSAIKEFLGDTEIYARGKIILGTVFDDIHDIGKNIVKLNLEGAGFKIIDLGIDVKPEVFINACKENNPDIVGLSCLLSTTMLNMETTVQAIREAHTTAKIIVGGNPVTQNFADNIGADGYAPDGYMAVKKVEELLRF
jgi:5-methyltetrahydrofolate--homocysteine methyltransferase